MSLPVPDNELPGMWERSDYDAGADEVRPSRPENLAYELGWAALGEAFGDDDGCEAARAMGASIVSTEEMQAIKAVLRHLAIRQAMDVQAPTVDVLRLLGLPEIVVEWVLNDDEPSRRAARRPSDACSDGLHLWVPLNGQASTCEACGKEQWQP